VEDKGMGDDQPVGAIVYSTTDEKTKWMTKMPRRSEYDGLYTKGILTRRTVVDGEGKQFNSIEVDLSKYAAVDGHQKGLKPLEELQRMCTLLVHDGKMPIGDWPYTCSPTRVASYTCSLLHL
jgi:hypothetical protein